MAEELNHESSGSIQEETSHVSPEPARQLANQIEELISLFSVTADPPDFEGITRLLQRPEFSLNISSVQDNPGAVIDMFVAQVPSFPQHLEDFVEAVNNKWPELNTDSITVNRLWKGVQILKEKGEHAVIDHHLVFVVLDAAKRLFKIAEKSSDDDIAATTYQIIELAHLCAPKPSTTPKTSGSNEAAPEASMKSLLKSLSSTLGDIVEYIREKDDALMNAFGPDDTTATLEECADNFWKASDLEAKRMWTRALCRWLVRGILERRSGVGNTLEKLRATIDVAISS